MNCLLYISQIFHNFAVGIGALLAGGAGYVAVRQYIASTKRQSLIDTYKSRYPRKDLNESFFLAHSPVSNQGDRIYILDIKTKKKHWIKNRETLIALDFDFGDANKTSKLFNSYSESDIINFF